MSPRNPPSRSFDAFDLTGFASKLAFVVPQAVLPDLKAGTKADAIQELIARLASVGAITEECEGQVMAVVMERETLGTTAIGQGVAVPHARHAAIPRVIAAVGFSPNGIAFDALDDLPVHLVVLVLSPADAAGDSLRALQQIVTELRTV